MNFNMIGMHSDNAIGHVLHLYDGKTIEEKIRLLLNNRPMENLKSSTIPKQFKSGKTIDINAGELLGLGLVVSYYDWSGENSEKTYQVVVGAEDSVKAQTENLLSDGGIWDNQTKKKMPFQQVMVQGYYPKTKVTTGSVIKQINDKVRRRSEYPEHCGLIVNMYSQEGAVDLGTVARSTNIQAYDVAFAVVYSLPMLDVAKVINLHYLNGPDLTISLKRYPRSEEWEFNYDDAKPYR